MSPSATSWLPGTIIQWYIIFVLNGLAFYFLSTFDQCPAIVPSGLGVPGSAVARVSEAPPEISRGAPHTLLAYYYELQ